MKLKYIQVLKEKRGVAIMSVMLFFMVMMTMVGALTISSQGNLNLSGVNSQSVAAYYAAEAGITSVVSDFQELMVDNNLTLALFYSQINGIIDETNLRIDLSSNFGEEAFAVVNVTRVRHDQDEKEFEVIIESVGEVNGQIRTLETRVELEYGSLSGDNQGFAIKHAVLVRNQLTTRNNAIIRSSTPSLARIATFSRNSSRINLAANTDFNGKIELVDEELTGVVVNTRTNWRNRIDQDNVVIDTPFAELDFGPIRSRAETVLEQFPLILGFSTDEGGKRVIKPTVSRTDANPIIIGSALETKSYFVDSIDFSNRSNRNVVIRADHDVFIVTNSLTLGNAKFIGNGEVTIYVKQGGTFNFATRNNSLFGRGFELVNGKEIADKPYLLVVYVDELLINNLTVSNNSKINGSFMFDNASVTFSNGTSFGGYFMTGGTNVTLSNNGEITTTFFYVPEGSVRLSQNASVSGAIISLNVVIENNAEVIYDPNFTTNFPFSITSPVADNTPSDDVGIKVLNVHRTTEQ